MVTRIGEVRCWDEGNQIKRCMKKGNKEAKSAVSAAGRKRTTRSGATLIPPTLAQIPFPVVNVDANCCSLFTLAFSLFVFFCEEREMRVSCLFTMVS